MKSLILATLGILCCLFLLPIWFPFLTNHAFTLGEMNVKYQHLAAVFVLYIAFKGGN